ncbi:hypothetical protein D3C73_1444180 [compost metagenome]
MHEALLSELRQFVDDLEQKEAAAVYIVPNEVMKAVKKAKSLEKLLHEIFMQVSGHGGIHLIPIILAAGFEGRSGAGWRGSIPTSNTPVIKRS